MSEVPPDSFDFYLNLAKPLVLNLADSNDRIVAAAWVQKLRDPNVGSEQLRTDYLKLLLFVLQRAKVIGPFKENPNNYDKLEEFPPDYKLHDVARELLQAEEAERRQRILRGLAGPHGDYPPLSIEYSSNLLEYCAAQDIPNFGVHAYYALSKEPLSKWDNLTPAIFPRGVHLPEESIIDLSTSRVEEDDGDLSVLSSTAKSRSKSHYKSKSTLGIPSPDVTSAPDVSGDAPPKRPSPKVTVQIGETMPREERVAPTWGSNLGNVMEAHIAEETCPCPDEEDVLEDSFAQMEKAAGISPKRKSPTKSQTIPTPETASEAAQKLIEEANRQFAELPLPTQQTATVSEVPEPDYDEYQPMSPQTSPAHATVRDVSEFQAAKVQSARVMTPPSTVRELNLSDEYKRMYPDRSPSGARTPPLFSQFPHIRESMQGQRVYRPDELPDVGPIDWEPGGSFFQSKSRRSPYMDPRLESRVQSQTLHTYFPSASPTDDDIFGEEPQFDDLDTSFVQAEKDVTQQETVEQIVQAVTQQEDSIPAESRVPITTPLLSPSPRRKRDIFDLDTSPVLFQSPPHLTTDDIEGSEAVDEFGLPVAKHKMLTQAMPREAYIDAIEEAQFETPYLDVSPPSTPSTRRSPRQVTPKQDTVPITTILSPRGPSPQSAAICPGSPKISSPRPGSPKLPSPKISSPRTPRATPSSRRPAWSPEISPPKRFPLTPVVGVTSPPPQQIPSKEFLFSRDMLAFEEAPEGMYPKASPPRPPAPFPYEEVATPERVGLADVSGTSPPLRELLEAHEIPDYFKDPKRPKMRKFVRVGKRKVPTVKEKRYLEIPSPIQEKERRVITPYEEQKKEQTPQASRPLTDTEKYFVNEFVDPKQRELVSEAMSLISNVETEEPLPHLHAELPHALPLSIPIGQGAVQLTTVSPPKEYAEFAEIETKKTAEEQYASLFSPTSPRSAAPCGTQICRARSPDLEPQIDEEDMDDFEALEAAMLAETADSPRRMGTPPSVPRQPQRTYTPRIPWVPTQAERFRDEAAFLASTTPDPRSLRHVPSPQFPSTPPSVPRAYSPRTPPVPWVPTWTEMFGGETAFMTSFDLGDEIPESPPLLPQSPATPEEKGSFIRRKKTKRIIRSPSDQEETIEEDIMAPRKPSKHRYPFVGIAPQRLDFEEERLVTSPTAITPRRTDIGRPGRRMGIPRKIDFDQKPPMTPVTVTPTTHITPQQLQAKGQPRRRGVPRRLDFGAAVPQEEHVPLREQSVLSPTALSPRRAAMPTPGRPLRVTADVYEPPKRIRRPRRIDFDIPEPPKEPSPPICISPVGETPHSKLARQLIQRYNVPGMLPSTPQTPLPEELMGYQAPVSVRPSRTLMDMPVPDVLLPSPMKAPSTVPGWQTPENLRVAPRPVSIPLPPAICPAAQSPVLQRMSPISQQTSSVQPRISPVSPRASPVSRRMSPRPRRLTPISEAVSPDLDMSLDEFEQLEQQLTQTPPRTSPCAAGPSVQDIIAQQEAMLYSPRTPRRSPVSVRQVTPAGPQAMADEQYQALFTPPRSPTGHTPPQQWQGVTGGLAHEEIPYEFIQESPEGTTPPTKWVALPDDIFEQAIPEEMVASPTQELRSPMIQGGLCPAVFPTGAPPSGQLVYGEERLPSPKRYIHPPAPRTPQQLRSPRQPQGGPWSPPYEDRPLPRRRLVFDDSPEGAVSSPCPAAQTSSRISPRQQADILIAEMEPMLSDIPISPVTPTTKRPSPTLGEFHSPITSPTLPQVTETYQGLGEEEFEYRSPTTPSPSSSRSPYSSPESSYVVVEEEIEEEETEGDLDEFEPIGTEDQPEFMSPPCTPPRAPPSPPATFQYESPPRSPEYSPGFRQRVEAHTPKRTPSYTKKRTILRKKMVPRLQGVQELPEPTTPETVHLGSLVSLTPPDRTAAQTAAVFQTAADQYAALLDSPEMQASPQGVASPEYGGDIMESLIPGQVRRKLPLGLVDVKPFEFHAPPSPRRSPDYGPSVFQESPPREFSPEITEEIEEEEIISSPSGDGIFDEAGQYDDYLYDVEEPEFMQTPPHAIDYGPETLPSPFLGYTPPMAAYDFSPEFFESEQVPQESPCYGSICTSPQAQDVYQSPEVYDYGPETVPSPMLSFTPSRSPEERRRFRQRVQEQDNVFKPVRYPQTVAAPRLGTLGEAAYESPDRYRPCGPPLGQRAPPRRSPPPEIIEETEEIITENVPSPTYDGRHYTEDEMKQFKFLDY